MSQPSQDINSQVLTFFASLFTVKDGLIFIESFPPHGNVAAQDDEAEQFVFADVNGDDWFYFEDNRSEETSSSSQGQCAKLMTASHFNVRTISGSDTTLIDFQYESQPPHTVLDEGRCNFAGLKPASSSSQTDPDSGRFGFHFQEMK